VSTLNDSILFIRTPEEESPPLPPVSLSRKPPSPPSWRELPSFPPPPRGGSLGWELVTKTARADPGIFLNIRCTMSRNTYHPTTTVARHDKDCTIHCKTEHNCTCTWLSREGRNDLWRSNMILRAVRAFSSLSSANIYAQEISVDDRSIQKQTFIDKLSKSSTYGLSTSVHGNLLNISKIACLHLFSSLSQN
jgi:hypothetical protein